MSSVEPTNNDVIAMCIQNFIDQKVSFCIDLDDGSSIDVTMFDSGYDVFVFGGVTYSHIMNIEPDVNDVRFTAVNRDAYISVHIDNVVNVRKTN